MMANNKTDIVLFRNEAYKKANFIIVMSTVSNSVSYRTFSMQLTVL